MMLVGSILIGAIAGFALLNYVNGVEQDINAELERVPVWVIAQDIPAGTTATDVENFGGLELREVETQFRPNSAISDLQQIAGRIAVNNLAANQILVAGMFDDPETIETTFADLIEQDQIAFTISIDPLRAVGGQVEAGDFVDLIVVSQFEDQPDGDLAGLDVFENNEQSSVYTQTVRFLYRGVRIVGINSEFVGQAAEEGVAPAAATGPLQITLALPADSAQRILSVSANELYMALHPDDWDPTDPETGAIENIIPELIVGGELLPGEDAERLTPYGKQGFVDVLAEAAEAADAADAIGADEAQGETAPAEIPESAPAPVEADASNEEG